MWIFLNDAFLSIIEHHRNPDMMIVRARVAGDITTAFSVIPNLKIDEIANAGTDYQYRTTISRAVVAEAMAAWVMNNHAHNFKSTVSDPDRHDAYMNVWTVMDRFGRSNENRRGGGRRNRFADY